MALHHNPRIVTDGLVLHLDAANTKSFRGEPTINLFTTPIDLSGDDWSIGNTPSEITRTWDQLDSDGTNNALKFESIDSAYYPHTNFSFTPENTNGHTITCYIKSLIGNQSLYIILFKVSPWASIGGFEIITVTSEWQRFSMTRNPLDTTQHRVFIGVHLATAPISSFLIHKVQMEEKSYDTPFVNGTRGTTVATGGGLIDLSGNDNDGTLENSPTYDSDNGGSLVFNGSTSRVSLEDDSSLENDSHTVSVWYKRTTKDTVAADGIIGNWYWNSDAQTRRGWCIRYYINQDVVSFICELTDGETIEEKNISTSADSLTSYYNVVSTHNHLDRTIKLYLNGIFKNSTTASVGFNLINYDSPNDLRIGYNPVNSGYFPGNIANVKIYNKALTQTEITQNYNALKGRFDL
jgi:hypothetical protein